MISTIITEGFGSFGTIAFIVTDGYAIGAAPPSSGVPLRTLLGVGI